MRGIRGRLTVTLVALVALTAVLLGAGAYLFVDNSLHAQVLARRRGPGALRPVGDGSRARPPADPTVDDIVDSRLRETFQQRGVESIIDFGAGGAVVSTRLGLRGRARRAPGRPARSASRPASSPSPGRRSPGSPRLVVGGRAASGGPAFYFVHDVSALEDGARPAPARPRSSGRVVLILLALLVARVVARGVLAPVEAASRAAERIEHGDLSARVPVTSDDEFGTWAERFNRMAEALADTIGRLEAAEAQNRRFVADVAHELRTPLAALVAEASILREHLDALPAGSRRAGELLVADVAPSPRAGRRPDGGVALRRRAPSRSRSSRSTSAGSCASVADGAAARGDARPARRRR